MANPSISVPDELLDEFDEVIKQKKLNEELPMSTSRSEVIADLMEEYVEGNGNSSRTATATASS